MYFTACPLRGLDLIQSSSGVFQGRFPLHDHTLPTCPEPAWQKMPQWHHPTCEHRGERLKSNHGQTMAGKRKETRQLDHDSEDAIRGYKI